jgi:diguanylate cyclase (GGDEF)-like protein/PAS domain S-box-containing protein
MTPFPYTIRDTALLLVEDEPEASGMLARMLAVNYPGLQIHVADNGITGLELFRQFYPEIVLTDLNMPVMNGIQMAREIKALAPDTVVVAVTAYSDTSYLLSAIEIGIHNYVLKPLNYSDLFGALDTILEKIMLQRLVREQDDKIRRREQQLSEAQKITHLGSWEWDPATGQAVWSDELYRILGLEPEQVAPSLAALLVRVHPQDRAALEGAVQLALGEGDGQVPGEGGELAAQDFRVVRGDGSTRIVHGQLETLRDDQGRPQAVVGTCLDITELKSAEEALRASEQKFFRIFQSTPDLLCITSAADGSFLEVNDAFVRQLGYPRSGLIGRRERDCGVFAQENEREGAARAMEDLGELSDLEVHLRAASGRVLSCLMAAQFLEINGRRCLLTLFKDITERKRLEEEHARLASIVESSDDAIMATDPGGIITIWNAGAERLFGMSAPEIRGTHLAALAPADRSDYLVRLCQEGGKREQVSHLDMVHQRRDGRQLNISLNLSSLKDSEGRIVGLSGIARDVTRRTEREETIKHQALHDPLTDLPNRKLFMDFLALEVAQARRNRRQLAVLFLDLDRFKQINDTLGHTTGDLLLQAVSQRLKSCVRESDTVARIGGDEFNVLMPDLHQTEDVGTVVGKIMGVFETPFLLENVEISAATSIGVSMFPVDGDTAADLVAKADSAMYVAKQKSGNSYQFFNAEINTRTVRRQKMERLLRQAVSRDELELAFQPLLRLDTGTVVGAEALLRWRHPEDGLLLPDQFLPVAEETGAIVGLGEWAIRAACLQMKQWRDRGYRFAVTVNLSTRQFHQPNLVEMTANVLRETGLDPQSLELDVTENAIMEDLDSSLRNMRRLTDIGVNFSVDDFGIGASSLHCIKQLPIGRVKIDRSFIKDILTQSNDLAVVNAVISMSHNLSMTVNAVGVESQEQLALVRDNGCDEAQGDLISKPLPAEEFEALVANL